MRSYQSIPRPTNRSAILIVLLMLALATPLLASAKYKVLYSFKGGNDGIVPLGNLVFDKQGNLYGTTQQGGGADACRGSHTGCGIVFQLSPHSGKWSESVLYSFQNGASEGVGLNGHLMLDAAGDVYGTAFYGGAYFTGIVFELMTGNSGWTESDIYTFCTHGCSDGEGPGSGVILDKSGNLYGTADEGGTDGAGVIFELTPSSGVWTESVLYNFCPYETCHGGWFPSGMIEDANGKFYGSTTWGGNFFFPCTPGDGCGVIFEFDPATKKYSVLHRFNGREGAFPSSGLAEDKQGNFYGTTSGDGAFACGTAFRISPKAGGGWKYSTLYNFVEGASAGSLAIDSSGNLYGAISGVMSQTCQAQGTGEIFRLSPGSPNGHWKFSSVYKLSGQEGAYPSSGLIFDAKGNLYGVAGLGGAHGYGVVFEFKP